MKEKLIYEKEYPPFDRISQPEYDKTESSENPSGNLYIGIRVNTQYTAIPERDRKSGRFIREAIRVSELYRMDIRIIRHYEKISVQLSFDFGGDMQYISRLFGMADRISFFKDKSEHDIAARLDFYTHVVVRNGLAVAP